MENKSNALYPPVDIGQTVYSLGKTYSKCSLGCTYDDIRCQGCEIECNSIPEHYVNEEIVQKLVWDGYSWRVVTNKSYGHERSLEVSADYSVFREKERVEEMIKLRTKKD